MDTTTAASPRGHAMTQRTVGDVMTRAVVTVRLDTHHRDIAATLVRLGVSGVPVLDDADRPVGVVSEEDLLAKERSFGAEHGGLWVEHTSPSEARRASAQVAADLMTGPAHTVDPSTPLRAAAQLLHTLGVRRLLVVNDTGRLVGIVTRRDMLKAFLMSDDEIRAAVEDALALRRLIGGLAGVSVAVNSGLVHLTGRVERHSDAIAVAGLARLVAGVEGVDCAITFDTDDMPGAPASLT